MTITKRQLALALSLALLPALVHADPLYAVELLLGLMAGALLLVGAVLLVSFLAYRRPQQPWLRWLSWVLTGVAVVAGVAWQRAFSDVSVSLSVLRFNPFLALCLPVALWLNGVWYARQAAANWPRMLGLAAGVLGLNMLLGQGLNLLFTLTWSSAWHGSVVVLGLLWALHLGLLLLAWRVVLRQVQQAEPLPWADWPQLATTAGVYACVALVYSLCSTWLALSAFSSNGRAAVVVADQLPRLLLSAALNFGAASLMLWWEQRRRTGQSPAL